ncbi:bacterial Ig-like domain-containing protein [Listeria monocytogenes]
MEKVNKDNKFKTRIINIITLSICVVLILSNNVLPIVFAENESENERSEEPIEKETTTSSESSSKDSSSASSSDSQEFSSSENELVTSLNDENQAASTNPLQVNEDVNHEFRNEKNARENIEFSVNGNTMTVTLSNEPKVDIVVRKIRPTLKDNHQITNLIVNGKFDESNNTTYAHLFNETNLQAIEFQNSNRVPGRFFNAGEVFAVKSTLKSYKDDGTVNEMGVKAFVGRAFNGSDGSAGFGNYNNEMTSFESPSLYRIQEGIFNGYKGEELLVPSLYSSIHSSEENYIGRMDNNFTDMPNVKTIDLSGLEKLEGGWDIFAKMPKLETLDLSKLGELSGFDTVLDSNNNTTRATKVDLSKLTILNVNKYVGSTESKRPLYIKLGEKRPTKLYNDDTNAIYYHNLNPSATSRKVVKGDKIKLSSIGDDGFLSYGKEGKVRWYDAFDDDIGHGKLYEGTEVNIDTNELSVGMHGFYPVIVYKGNVDFGLFPGSRILVEVIDDPSRPVTATAVPQTHPLGRALEYLKAEDLIKDTKIGSETVGSDEYNLKIKQMPDSNVIGTKEIIVTITRKHNGVENDIKVPLEITWGNSLKINGTNHQTVMGVTTHESSSGFDLIATRGQNDKKNPLIHQSIKDEYVNIGLIHPDNKQLDQLKPYYEFSKKGSDKVDEAFKSFERQKAKVGDIIQVKHKELVGDSHFVEVATENKFTTPTEGYLDNRSYFEIDSAGKFKAIHINQLKGKESTIFTSSNQAYLDQHIQEFIDFKGYKNIIAKEFKTYPKTDKVGSSKGIILVEEQLNSGKKIQWEYEVDFVVKEDKTSIKTKDLTLSKGQSWKREDNFVSATDEEGKLVPWSDSRITANGATVDTTKPGTYEFTYTFKGKFGNVDSKCKVVVKETLTAEPNETTENLGGNSDYWTTDSMIKNVKIGDKTLSAGEYSTKLKTKVNTNIVGEQQVVMEVSAENQTIEVTIPVVIQWGNSIKLNGSHYQTIMGLTSHKNNKGGYALIATRGKKDNVIGSIHQSYKDEYINICLIHPGEIPLNQEKPYYKMEKKGNDSVNDAYQSFTRQEAKIGDIVQIYHKEMIGHEKFVEVSLDNTLSTPTKGYLDNKSYFEIDSAGKFQPLRVNQMKIRDNISTVVHSSNDDLNNDLIENPSKYYENSTNFTNIKLVGFSKYPDTSTPGEQAATIRFEETLKSGKKVQWEYEVDFIVKDDRPVTATAVPQTFTLGWTLDYLKAEDLIKDPKIGSEAVGSDGYNLKIKQMPDSNVIGKKEIIITITRKFNGVENDIKIPLEITWGNSVVYGGFDYVGNGRTTGAFTLLTGTSPSILSSQGKSDDNKQIHSNFPNKQYYTFNWFDLSDKQILIMDENDKGSKYIQANGNDLKQEKLKEWGTNQKQAVNYGDVVRAWQRETNKNWLYENEERQSYNEGEKSVYYEITKTGFQPLRVNQLKMRDDILIFRHTNETDLEKDIKENPSKYYENPANHDNINVVGFTKYPDTSTAGKKPATIRFEETLKSGKKIQYDYDIQVNVDDKWVNVTIPTKMLFFSDMKNEKKDKVISESYSITNNSDNTSLEVEMASFSVEKNSEVTYLSAAEKDPTNPENKLRLNLFVNDQSKVQSLNSETKAIKLIDLDFKTSAKLTFEGNYFNANSEDSSEAKSSMVLKFNIKR